MHASFTGGRGYYGSPRIHDDFVEWQEPVSRKRIIRLMQEEGLKARVRKRYKGTTMSDHDQPIADNLLQQEFTAERPNQRWVGDTSELRIGENGKAYLAVVLDLFSRFVVGWAISAVNDRHLTIKALDMAVKRRCPEVGLLHHSDQGSTYASEDYQAVLEAHGITCSMSRRGNCYDNAVMEAFPARHEMIGQPFGARRMGYVQTETRRGWGLGGSPEGDRRGLSLADARREGPVVGAAQDVGRVGAAARRRSREPQSSPRRDGGEALGSGVTSSSPAAKRT